MDEARVWSEIEALYRGDFRQFERVARAITGDRAIRRSTARTFISSKNLEAHQPDWQSVH